jgi:hypothetical protein
VSLNQKIRVPSLVLPLFLLGVADHTAIVLAQSAGAFTATGNMTTPRVGHTATLLADGRVLIVGGYTDENSVEVRRTRTASAELFDPATGTFIPTGNMIAARSNHTATLLPDGRVLIAGGVAVDYVYGVSDASDWASTELYDPSTGTFAAAANMTTPRSDHVATLLPDGRVLIFGGVHAGIGPIADYSAAELYDSGLNTFTATAIMGGTPVTLLSDGRVLLAGFPSASILYDPRTDTLSHTGGDMLLTDRATLLPNGKILEAGGNNDPGASALAEEYDPSTGIFMATESMSAPRANYTATLLADGKVFITGGRTGISTTFSGSAGTLFYCCLTSAELYDPSTRTFTATGNMATPRNYHTATLLPDGRVLIAGGSGGSSIAALATAELYRPIVLTPAPRLYSLSGGGHGQGAIWHAITGEMSSPDSPAVAGEILSMYTTSLVHGGVIPPQVAIGGRLAEILYFGDAPGYAGYDQVNFRVPNGVASGPTVSVRLTYLGRPSNEVTIGVR